jgi:TRAP-type C4-dicarboxylate transport system permease small subunit
MMVMLPLGIAWCAVENRHIMIDEIIKRFPPRTVAIIDSITLLAVFGISALITWRLIISALFEYQFKTIISLMVRIPAYPFWWILAIAWIVFCLVLVNRVYENIREVVKR